MPLMCYWYTYGIVTVFLLGVLSYGLGLNVHSMDDDDLAPNAFIGGIIIIMWPVMLALLCIVAPFMGPYYLGKRHHRIKTEKEEMWKTLKR